MEIAIIGGGIAGLTTAVALQKQGLSCKIYEQASELTAVGAGIWIQPNAMKVMDFLGLGDKIRSKGTQLDRVDIADKNLHPFNDNVAGNIHDNKGQKIVSIHRAALLNILFEAIEPSTFKFNSTYRNHAIKGKKINIEFNDYKIEADLLLAADGIQSKIRKNIFPSSALRSAKQICCRAISNYTLPATLAKVGRECWGQKIRFGFSQVTSDQVYWFAVISESVSHGLNFIDLKNSLQTKFKDFHPVVNEIISTTKIENIHRTELSDLKRLKCWYKDNICVLGDAAHATTPNMGQGACQGIEDAYYLSSFLSKSENFNDTFEKFEKSRREKVDYVVNNSWRFGKMAHHPLGQFLLKWIMKSTPEKMLHKQLQKLYSIQEFSH